VSHDIKLGRLIEDPNQQRDAIHIAVAPVVAVHILYPGQHIGFVADGDTTRVGTATKQLVGIVDPFLTNPVYPDQRCFMFLYQNTVTGMRHHWEHPAFAEAVESTPQGTVPSVAESEKWIAAFAAKIYQTPSRLMDAAARFAEWGDHTYDSSENYKDHWDSFPEFWKHYEIVTGKPIEDKESCPFTCSC
jgi:hypothetical protein